MPNLNERFLEGNIIAGNFKEAGLPNITGSFTTGRVDSVKESITNGAFIKPELNAGSENQAFTGVRNTTYSIRRFPSFDASRSNPIYGKSITVQPLSYTVRYLIRAQP